MPVVLAKCPECGGTIKVESEKQLGICENCGNPFVVEDAINNFTNYYTTNYITNNNTTHNYGDGAVVNVFEDTSKDFVIEAGVLKEYHGASVNVVLPSSVKSIYYECFKNTPIESIQLNSSISVGNWSTIFGNCTCLKDINVNFENPYYTSKDGIVFSKDGNELLFIPRGKSQATIPTYITKFKDSVTIDTNSAYRTEKKQLYNCNFNKINYKNINLLQCPCTEKTIIREAEEKGLPTLIQHDIKKGKCSECGKDFTIYTALVIDVSTPNYNCTVDIELMPNESTEYNTLAIKKVYNHCAACHSSQKSEIRWGIGYRNEIHRNFINHVDTVVFDGVDLGRNEAFEAWEKAKKTYSALEKDTDKIVTNFYDALFRLLLIHAKKVIFGRRLVQDESKFLCKLDCIKKLQVINYSSNNVDKIIKGNKVYKEAIESGKTIDEALHKARARIKKEILPEEYFDVRTEVLAVPKHGIFNRQDAKVKVWVDVYR